MKDIIIIAVFCAILVSCSDNSEKNPTSDNNTIETNTKPQPDISTDTSSIDSSGSKSSTQIKPGTDNIPFVEGKNLIKESNCLSCHKEQEKIVGPAYIDVAKKYKATDANIKMLAGRIINGNTGIWGTSQMTPHPDLTEEDAEKMVYYILSLKEQ